MPAVISRQVTAITADNFTVHVEGARELRAALRAVQAQWPKVMREANKQAAEVVAGEAKRRAPVLTGRLKESVRAGATQSAGYVQAGSPVRIPYAAVQEFGWPGHNISPQPYVYPAIAAKSSQVVETYGEAIDRVTRVAFPT